VTGPILRCNTRVELTVTEFLRLDRMPRPKHAVPARLHCELEHQHDGDHVAFAQAGEGAHSDTAEWWIRWNGGRRDITELPWCLAKDPSWPEDADEDDPGSAGGGPLAVAVVVCGRHRGADAGGVGRAGLQPRRCPVHRGVLLRRGAAAGPAAGQHRGQTK
jgi:hypothetical protein